MTSNNSELKNLNQVLILSKFFFVQLGLEPYKHETRRRNLLWSVASNFILACTILNTSYSIIAELMLLTEMLKSVGKNAKIILNATALGSTIGYFMLTSYKLVTISIQNDKVTYFMKVMVQKYPKAKEELSDFDFKECKRFTLKFEKFYSSVMYFAIWTFNLSGIGESFVRHYLIRDEAAFVYRYAFVMYYPFNITSNWIYGLVYVQQIHSGLIAVGGTLAADLLMINMIFLCCMHLDYISKRIRKLEPETCTDCELKEIIKHHQIILELCEIINDFFSLACLFNFFTSSILICLIGFQITVGSSGVELFKYFLFLICELMQVWTLCYVGEKLIISSSEVGNAAYSNIFNFKLEHQKIMLYVIVRANKPAVINAKSFAIVSLESYTRILSTSYSYFALLRTLYFG